MNAESTIKYNSLSWVKEQLDVVLTDAQKALSDFAENNENTDSLVQCVDHLRLVCGTLQMVEIYGAAMLAEEMQKTAQAQLEGKADTSDAVFDILMRSMLQLPDYLEGLQAGNTDSSLALLPLMNDLRAARKESLLSESVLFFPDLDSVVIDDVVVAEGVAAGKLHSEAKRLRTHYQIGLLDLIKNNKKNAGLKRMQAVIASLEKVTSIITVKNFWVVISVLIDSIVDEGAEVGISEKMILGAVDRQLKLLIDTDEESFSGELSSELFKNALYYIGRSKTDNERINKVKKAYKLDELLPDEVSGDAAGSGLGGLNAELFITVSNGIKDDLTKVKDTLEIFVQSNEKDVATLEPLVDELNKIGDTYGMLGLGVSRTKTMDQAAVIESAVRGEAEISDTMMMSIADELLSAESELNDYIAQRSGLIDSKSIAGEENAIPAGEYREVLTTVVREALSNFTFSKEAILSYISGIGEKEQVESITQRLEEVRGITLMLSESRVESQVTQLMKYVQLALIDNNHMPDEKEQEAVADLVTCIEYFLESMVEGRLGVEAGLVAGDAAAEYLSQASVEYENKQVLRDEVQKEIDAASVVEAAADKKSSSDSSNLSDEARELATEDKVENQEADSSQEEYIILSDDADEEILEIFIEEAEEVLEALNESYPQWKSDNNNEEALTIVRRSFHTLKGSGRLIGAHLIGEFSWKFENMLNRLIDKQIKTSDEMYASLDQAMAAIPQLIEQLKGNREPINGLYDLMHSADIICEGGIPESGSKQDEVESADELLEVADESLAESDFDTEEIVAVSFDEVSQDEEISLETEEDELIEFDSSGELSVDEVADVTEEIAPLVEETQEESELIIESQADEITPDEEIQIEELIPEDDDKLADELVSEVDVVTISEDSDFEIDAADGDIEINHDLSSDDESIVLMDEESSTSDIEIDDFEDPIAEFDVDVDASITVDEDTDSISLDDIDSDSDISIDDEAVAAENEEFIVSLSDFDDEETKESIDFTGLDDVTNKQDPEDVITLDDSDDDITEIQVSGDDDLVDLDVYDFNEDDISTSEDEEESSLKSESIATMDPVLFEIYYEESMDRLHSVQGMLDEHAAGRGKLCADKELIRAFHTLYGSARTADIEQVSELCGAMEKYVKAREESENPHIPEDVVGLVQQVVSSTQAMIVDVKSGAIPSGDKALLAKIHVALQDELQDQLQQSAVIVDEGDETQADDFVELDQSFDIEEEVSGAIADAAVDSAINDEVDEPAEVISESGGQSDIQVMQPVYEEIDDDLIDIFLEEADELLESCDNSIIALKADTSNRGAITVLQRDMHTLKGGARMAELTPVGDLTHELESLVIKLEENEIEADNNLFSIIHESMDSLNDMLSSVKKRSALKYSTLLIDNIKSLISGKPLEFRSVERFDIEIDDLDGDTDDDLEEEITISEEALASVEKSVALSDSFNKDEVEAEVVTPPAWGERATDANYKESQDQVRIKADLLNSLVNSAGEVNIFHARMGKQITDVGFNLSELEQTVVRLKDQLRNLDIETEIQIRSSHEKESDRYEEDFDPLEMDRYSTMQQLSRSLTETASDVQSIKDIIADIIRDSETLLLQESRVSSELQEGLMRTRMIRFGGLSSRMRRIVRQTARELNKEVELEISGDTIEVDRKVLDNIVAPLEHMLRNAVAHGIEDSDKRVASGKAETGKISIDIDRTGAEIVIKVRDDGAGMNVKAIREKAISKGLLSVNNNLDDKDILQFALKAGFSTADSVSQVSGRGVGMDVVDSEIKQLGGLLEIDTVSGKGTLFTITLPVTLAINQALLVSSNEDIYAVPLSSIEGVVRITGAELQKFYDGDNKTYNFNGVEYELKHLGNLLTGRQADYSKQYQLFPVLLAKVGEHYFALHVDDLIERREIVVKPVGNQLGMVRGISGATILADGRVVLILEMAALVVGETLFRSVQTEEEVAEEKEQDREKVIMIVDDSITIRKVTSRMLERNGINVVSAKDGVDATNQLQEGIPDLMLLDIEMPRMDGFELATYMRNDDRLKDIPIIMITSRTGEKHKEKAFAIGVSKYLGKPYQEEELMKNINEIFGA